MNIISYDALDDVVTYLSSQEGSCFFRGQSPDNRLLNCTLARELRRETKYLLPNYIPIEPLSKGRAFFILSNIIQLY